MLSENRKYRWALYVSVAVANLLAVCTIDVTAHYSLLYAPIFMIRNCLPGAYLTLLGILLLSVIRAFLWHEADTYYLPRSSPADKRIIINQSLADGTLIWAILFCPYGVTLFVISGFVYTVGKTMYEFAKE